MQSVRSEDLPHARPELEALLPDSLSGPSLLRDSVDGAFALGNEDLYVGVFPAVVEALFPAERRSDDAFYAEQLERLWLATGYFERDGYRCALRLFVVDGVGPDFWQRVLHLLERGVGEEFRPPTLWTPAELGGVELRRADGLAANELRSLVLLRAKGLVELMLQGPPDRDDELVSAL